MRQVHTPLKRAIVGALMAAAYAIAGTSASAQTTSTTTSTSTSTSTTTAKRVPRTTATPEMIEEAVQRSKARFERFKATGRPEQFGSEEPFTPTKR